MTRKQGLALRPGIYKVFWKGRKGHKIGGWTWCAIGEVHNHIPEPETRLREWLEKGCLTNFDRDIMSINWAGSLKGSRMWRKIAKVERAPLAKMQGE